MAAAAREQQQRDVVQDGNGTNVSSAMVVDDEMHSAPHAVLAHDGRDVLFDGPLGDAEPRCDPLVGVAERDEVVDLALSRRQATLGTSPITPRETQVLGLLMLGLPNKRIGLRLGIAERTVKHHVSALLRKFAVRGRMDLIMLRHHAAADRSAPVQPRPD
jgi:DNA-binding CsgD family transcriptional regulator